MAVHLLGVVLGAALILVVLNDLFQSVIVPRAVGRRYRLSFYIWRSLWKSWPRVAWLFYPRNEDGREDFLALFAPAALIILLLCWTVIAMSGYGIVYFSYAHEFVPALRSFAEAMYYSGTSLTTLGYGDIAAKAAVPRFFSVIEALTGLALLSITTTFFFALFGSFQARESFVVVVGGRAGTPPSGINLLCIAGYSKTAGDLDTLWQDAQKWAATLMESHLAYPNLAFFRSSHDYESWIGTLGTLLDASVLLMTTVDGIPSGQARLFYNIGRHATGDLARYFRVDNRETRVERHEYDRACDRLARAGYTLKDRDAAWQEFQDLREPYEAPLNGLAHFFSIPPLQWIGDRSEIRTPHAH